jgi:hypothetical protein
MEHQFIYNAHNIMELFEGVRKFSTFKNRLEKQALLNPVRYPTEKYLGDGFEFFIELMLSVFPCDKRMGVYDYKPVLAHEDIGMDGSGVNINNEPCAVQIKYKTDTTSELTANRDRLSNFITAAAHQGIFFDNDNPKNIRHFIFTTAESLHHYTDNEMFKNKVRCFGIKHIKEITDNNIIFWEKITEMVKTRYESILAEAEYSIK